MAIVFGEALRRALSFYEWFVNPIDCLTRKMEDKNSYFFGCGVSTTCVRFQNVGRSKKIGNCFPLSLINKKKCKHDFSENFRYVYFQEKLETNIYLITSDKNELCFKLVIASHYKLALN